eukprot:13334945-Ditylum_brightwellii.AAC.1
MGSSLGKRKRTNLKKACRPGEFSSKERRSPMMVLLKSGAQSTRRRGNVAGCITLSHTTTKSGLK